MVILAADVTQNVGMSDDLKGAIITALVTGIISIIGFIVTNASMKKDFKNELKKQRDSVALEKMSTMPYEILELMDEMFESVKVKNENQKKRIVDKNYERFKEIMNKIYSYGSEDAIKIVSLMQKENYEANGNTDNMNKYRNISVYVLLATQIKYDVTEILVNTELWMQMRLTDYAANKEKIKQEMNKLVDELELRKEFKIK